MERQYTTLDDARKIIDDIIKNISDEENKRCAYVHLYGTGLMASIIALKRGYDRKTAELAEISGMLHDLLCYVDESKDGVEHASLCAEYAKENVLSKMESLTTEEKEMIYNAIYNHSNKKEKANYKQIK